LQFFIFSTFEQNYSFDPPIPHEQLQQAARNAELQAELSMKSHVKKPKDDCNSAAVFFFFSLR
jgi:hypothetical protein